MRHTSSPVARLLFLMRAHGKSWLRIMAPVACLGLGIHHRVAMASREATPNPSALVPCFAAAVIVLDYATFLAGRFGTVKTACLAPLEPTRRDDLSAPRDPQQGRRKNPGYFTGYVPRAAAVDRHPAAIDRCLVAGRDGRAQVLSGLQKAAAAPGGWLV